MHILVLIGKGLLIAFAAVNAVMMLYDHRQKIGFIWTVWKRFRPLMFLEVLLLLTLTVSTFLVLETVIPILKYGWANLFLSGGGNILVSPMVDASKAVPDSAIGMAIKLVIASIGLVMLSIMPFIAKAEEDRFRKGYHDIKSITKQSVKFGFIHLFVGIPIAVALALCGVGAFFAWKYNKAYKRNAHLDPIRQEEEAVMVSTTYHALYNTICVSLLFVLIFLL